MTVDVDIDALGLLCPLPVLRLRKRLQGIAAGEVLTILSDDPVAAIDIPHFCAQEGHAVLRDEPREGGRLFEVRKGG
ncbi:sulfurtransferase TusA family protein [Pseudooceanicola sp. C21-150M6]|uniref:sulfurtransferase TusA family protein n=1 Tax=Pseudooceanicola sp. C21-150M6 TaxID=3434355 RepID=UPI003D7FD6D4